MMIGKVISKFKTSKLIYYSYYFGFNVNNIIVLCCCIVFEVRWLWEVHGNFKSWFWVFLIWEEVVGASGMLCILIYMLFVVDLYLKMKLIEVRMPWLLHGCSNLLYIIIDSLKFCLCINILPFLMIYWTRWGILSWNGWL